MISSEHVHSVFVVLANFYLNITRVIMVLIGLFFANYVTKWGQNSSEVITYFPTDSTR